MRSTFYLATLSVTLNFILGADIEYCKLDTDCPNHMSPPILKPAALEIEGSKCGLFIPDFDVENDDDPWWADLSGSMNMCIKSDLCDHVYKVTGLDGDV